jgi:RNA polymerase sigma-70 factor (ECF subfamily)
VKSSVESALGASALSERQLFEAVHRRMRALAGSAAPDLDDLVQLAAEQVFRGLPGFTGRSELLTWVYAVCYRVLLNQRRWYRRWRLRFTFQSDEEQVQSHEPLPSAALEARERAQRLQLALAKMSDKYRAVVVLHDLEELNIKEVAHIVRANELTVRSRLRDGRKHLLRLLQADSELTNYGDQHELTSS